MMTAVTIVLCVLALIAIVAILAACVYKKQRDDAHGFLEKSEQTRRDVVEERDDARKDRDATKVEYDEFRKRAMEEQSALTQRYDMILRNHDEEMNLYKEIVDAKLDAPTAANLSDGASRVLQERRNRRRENRDGASTRETTVPNKKPA